MKKQVLVTVDRGETRVAMLEASGDPGAPTKSTRGRRGRGKKNEVPDGYRVAELGTCPVPGVRGCPVSSADRVE